MKSIMQNEKECYLCRKMYGNEIDLNDRGLEEHHCISGTANRRVSERTGLKVYLCNYHHELVHKCRDVELTMKQEAQMVYERTHSRDEFIMEFGKSWL